MVVFIQQCVFQKLEITTLAKSNWVKRMIPSMICNSSVVKVCWIFVSSPSFFDYIIKVREFVNWLRALSIEYNWICDITKYTWYSKITLEKIRMLQMFNLKKKKSTSSFYKTVMAISYFKLCCTIFCLIWTKFCFVSHMPSLTVKLRKMIVLL